MRFIHTADWHLGRVFYGVHLTEDQSFLLDQVVQLAKDQKPDAIIISGDIYDRGVPPIDAVSLLDDVLSRLVLDLKARVILIPGNHDSSERIAFGSRLLTEKGLHISGTLNGLLTPVILNDDRGSVYIYPLPYAEPALVRNRLGREDLHSHQEAMNAILENIREKHPPQCRSILVAHCFAEGGETSESERPLSIGGTEAISSSSFRGFNYVALGHLHRPQTIGDKHIRYSGSPMRYSFSESNHKKTITVVEMDESGNCKFQEITLKPKKEIRQISGFIRELLNEASKDPSPDDYLMVTLLDKGAILDAMGKLRNVYPNVLHIDRPDLFHPEPPPGTQVDHQKMNDQELFASFYRQVTGDDLDKRQRSTYIEVVDRMRHKEGEMEA